MKLVSPEERVTLLLNRNYQAFGYCTVRAAIRHLVTGRIKGMAADGNIYTWDGVDSDYVPGIGDNYNSPICWKDGNIALHDDQPYIRSAPNHTTGAETRNYIPTIAVCGHRFGFHKGKGDNVSLKTLYSVYKGTCQYCMCHIPMSQATKDHVYPKSKGGSNDDFNLVLACRKCNGEKDSIFPYFNADGKEVKPKKITSMGLYHNAPAPRPEWDPFLYKT